VTKPVLWPLLCPREESRSWGTLGYTLGGALYGLATLALRGWSYWPQQHSRMTHATGFARNFTNANITQLSRGGHKLSKPEEEKKKKYYYYAEKEKSAEEVKKEKKK